MKLSRQQPQEVRPAAEALAVAPALLKGAHALPEAFKAQAQAPSVRGLATMMPVASGATAVPDYDQPTLDLGSEARVCLVETPEFKSWFVGSKVTQKGKPLQVCHGTTAEFDVFSPGTNGISGWFGVGEDLAYRYTNSPEGARVINAYLCIKRPVFVRGYDADEDASISEVYEAAGLPLPSGTAFKVQAVHETVCSSEFVSTARAMGFDGIKISEEGITTFAAFEPEQIWIVPADNQRNVNARN